MYSKLREKYISRVHISVSNYMSMKQNKVTNMKELYPEEKKSLCRYTVHRSTTSKKTRYNIT